MLSDKFLEDKLITELQKKYTIKIFYSPNASRGIQDKSHLGPFGWLTEIQKCDLLITSFFHGTVFAIKYAIPFIAISLEDKQGGKIEDLIKESELNERMILCREFRNNEFRTDRIMRRILDVEKKPMDQCYAYQTKLFLEKQEDKAESFLQALRKRIKEIEENERKD